MQYNHKLLLITKSIRGRFHIIIDVSEIRGKTPVKAFGEVNIWNKSDGIKIPGYIYINKTSLKSLPYVY